VILRLRHVALALALASLGGAGHALTVPHLMGQTELAKVPRRIVVLEFGFMDALARLGVKPVGIVADGDKADQVLPHLRRFYPPGSVTVVGNRHAPSLEKILALKPDLIIADEEDHKHLYAQLSRIAPTLLFRSYRGSYADQLEQFSLISRVVGREGLGRTVLTEHRVLLDRARASSRPAAGRTAVGVLAPTGFFVHSDRSYVGSLLGALGRDNPVGNRDGQTQYVLSAEGLLALNPDTLIVLYNPEDEALFQKWRSGPLVRALNAAGANRVYAFNRDAWAKGRGVIGLEGILNDVIRSRVLSGEGQGR
jgi:iron complex transport system substrate-binding protein